jgi:hypothetical protein
VDDEAAGVELVDELSLEEPEVLDELDDAESLEDEVFRESLR